MKFSKNVNNKKHAPKLIFFNEIKMRKIRIIFEIENWLWKLEIGSFPLLDLEQILIWKLFFYEKVIFFTIWCRSWWKILKCYQLDRYCRYIVRFTSLISNQNLLLANQCPLILMKKIHEQNSKVYLLCKV